MSEKKPIVWVAQEARNVDYCDAERFGDVHFMTAHEFKPIANSQLNPGIIEAIDRAATAFDPKTDSLVLTGNPVVIGYVFHKVREKADNGFNILSWDKMRGCYNSFVFKF